MEKGWTLVEFWCIKICEFLNFLLSNEIYAKKIKIYYTKQED